VVLALDFGSPAGDFGLSPSLFEHWRKQVGKPAVFVARAIEQRLKAIAAARYTNNLFQFAVTKKIERLLQHGKRSVEI